MSNLEIGYLKNRIDGKKETEIQDIMPANSNIKEKVLLDISKASAFAANSGGPITSLTGPATDWVDRLIKIDTALFKSKYNYTV